MRQALHHIPIYFASKTMVRCLPIYRQYIEFMNQHIRDKFETGDNPFEFKHINNLDNLRTLDGVN